MMSENEKQILALTEMYSTQQEWLKKIKQLYPADATSDDMALFWQEVTTILTKNGHANHQIWSYEQAIADFQQIGRTFEAYAFSVNLGLRLDRLSLHRQAVKMLRQALRMLKSTWNTEWPMPAKALQAITRHNLATAYLNEGKPQLAIKHNKAALALKQALHDEAGQITVLIGLANAHRDQGLYRQAADCYLRAKELANQYGDQQAEAKCALGLGNLTMAITDYVSAVSYYQQALAICEQHDFRDDLPTAYVSLGNALHYIALQGIKDDEVVPPKRLQALLEVMALYKKALAATTNADPLAMADILLKCGHVALDLGSAAVAEQSYEAALNLIYESNNYEATFETMTSLGDLALQRRDFCKALNWYQQTLTLSQVNHHQEHESMANANISYAYIEQGEWASAIPFLEISIQLSESLGRNLFIDEHMIGYFSSTQADYEALIHAYLGIGQSERAFHYLEKSKSKALLNMLGTGEIPIRSVSGINTFLQQEKRCRQAIRRLMVMGVASPEVTSLLKKLNRLYQRVETLAPEYVSVRRGDVLAFRILLTWLDR